MGDTIHNTVKDSLQTLSKDTFYLFGTSQILNI